jgi:hypothetical protein
MKLWLLHPVGYTDDDEDMAAAWKPWYDKAFGFVVRAESEQAARALANAAGGEEISAGVNPWLDPAQSTCVPLLAEGEAEVVLFDFHSA